MAPIVAASARRTRALAHFGAWRLRRPCTLGGTVAAMELTAIYAHQGGWDEVALVLLPLALLWVVLMVANRRARRARDEDEITGGRDGDGS